MRHHYWLSVSATLMLAITALALAVQVSFQDAYAQEEAAELPADPLEVPQMPRVAPGMANVFGDNYWYLPYAITNAEQGTAFVDAYREFLKSGKEKMPEQLKVAEGKGACDGNTLPRLQGDISQFFICDINNPAASYVSTSDIPVVITQPAPADSGANVLFLDGHVEFVNYGEFPMNRDFIEALMELDPPEYSPEDEE